MNTRPLEQSPCACGCGKILTHRHYYPSMVAARGSLRFAPGHHLKGRKQTPEHIAKCRRAGPDSARWKGGTRRHNKGYVLVKRRDHPHAQRNGYVYEHRLVMEAHLGRLLDPIEVVHHKNGRRDDNRLDNLELLPCNALHLRHELAGRARGHRSTPSADKSRSQR